MPIQESTSFVSRATIYTFSFEMLVVGVVGIGAAGLYLYNTIHLFDAYPLTESLRELLCGLGILASAVLFLATSRQAFRLRTAEPERLAHKTYRIALLLVVAGSILAYAGIAYFVSLVGVLPTGCLWGAPCIQQTLPLWPLLTIHVIAASVCSTPAVTLSILEKCGTSRGPQDSSV